MNIPLKIAHRFLLISIIIFHVTACGKTNESTNEGKLDSTPTTTSKAYLFDTNIGWLHGNCLAIKNSNIKSGTKVTLIILGDIQSTIRTELDGTATAESGCFALFSDRASINQNDNRSFYTVNIPQTNPNITAIGLIGTDVKTAIKNNSVVMDIDADGIDEYFDACETSEGMNFFVWSGAANKGKARWTDYYYLGYDLKPTCPEE